MLSFETALASNRKHDENNDFAFSCAWPVTYFQAWGLFTTRILLLKAILILHLKNICRWSEEACFLQ